VLGNPWGGVYEGEIQAPGLGMAVDVFGDDASSVVDTKGELVCTRPFPSTPIEFWNDPGDVLLRSAYFDRYPQTWAHGDFAEKKSVTGGFVIHGRSDAVLNPGGVRIGTAEIYRQVESIDTIKEALCIGQEWDGDTRVVLFVVMQDGRSFTQETAAIIRTKVRENTSPRHVPTRIVAVPDIPRTLSGKIAEIAVREVVHGRPVKNSSALANPDTLHYFESLEELQS
jgi:acetoacetyl-CoA synthetase